MVDRPKNIGLGLRYGETQSHLAVEERCYRFFDNVDKNELLKTDIYGETPLHHAVGNEDLKMCKLLISRNKKIIHMKDMDMKTAYDWAVEYNLAYNSHIAIVKELRQYL